MRRFLTRAVFRPYWRLTRAMTLGVRGVVRNEAGAVLLVRHTYMPGWHLPGGGVERGETLLVALERELQEEGGVAPDAPPVLHGVFANRGFAGDHVAVYTVPRWHEVAASPGREIAETGFFAPGMLPDGTSSGTRQRLAELVSGAPVSPFWSDTD